MKRLIAEIQAALAAALNAMPDVFSTVQWGGRAYKLPGPGSRGKKKPVLLTHVCMNKEGDAVCLGFRLDKSRVKTVLKQHAFIKPNSFGNLKNNGWLETAITTKAQCKIVIQLLEESRGLHPVQGQETAATKSKTARRGKREANANESADVKRIDAILRRKRDEGWTPAQSDAFDV